MSIESSHYNNERKKALASGEVIAYLHAQALLRRVIDIEGPAVYLYPDSKYRTQSWDNPAFVNGWDLVSKIENLIPSCTMLAHSILIDDFNNLPEDPQFDERRSALQNSSEVISSSPLFIPSHKSKKRIQYESDFAKENSRNQCSSLDAGFQIDKLLFHSSENGVLNFMQLPSLLVVLVHASEFQKQQSLMLSSMLGQIGRDSKLSKIPKKMRPDFLTHLYRHVWLNSNGEIEGITQPIWNGNAFVHKEESL